jgi:hypothetical protein
MAAPQTPQPNAPQGVISRPAAPLAQPPSTLDAARAAVAAGGLPTTAPAGVPTLAQQMQTARAPQAQAAPAAPHAPPPYGVAPAPSITPISAHPGFKLYSHEEFAAEQAPAPAAPSYAPPPLPSQFARAPGPDPALVALLTGTQETNARIAQALEKIGAPPAQAQGPPDPGPMPNAMLEPEKFNTWLNARDARQTWAIEQRLKAPAPEAAAQQEQQRAQVEFNQVTTPLFEELFAYYPGVVRVDAAALSGVVNAVATEVGATSLQALRLIASDPARRHDMYARIARRVGVAQGQPQAPPAPAAAQPAQYAGGFMHDPRYGAMPAAPAAQAPAPAPQPQYAMWNGQAWVPAAAPTFAAGPVVDRTFGMSGASMTPPAMLGAPTAPQIPSFGEQLAEAQRAVGIYGR